MTLGVDISRIPQNPGVYVFRARDKTILYIGKARNLRHRIRTYAYKRDDLTSKIRIMISHIVSTETIQTTSEVDAILLETALIHRYQPKYNTVAKDDKSPLYALLTISEELPRILTMRKTDLAKNDGKKHDAVFGPFQSGRMLRMLLRSIRRIIPFCTQKRISGLPCFYTHVGLCSPCPSYIAKLPHNSARQGLVRTYRHNIYRVRDILGGKLASVRRLLEREMNAHARKQEYEAALEVRNRIRALDSLLSKHYDPMVYLSRDTTLYDASETERDDLSMVLKPYIKAPVHLRRIECFDVSTILGHYATGSMSVLVDGVIDTSQYRRFRIRGDSRSNDVAMLQQVLERRLSHHEWPMPDLILVDGGKPQLSGARRTLDQASLSLPIIGLAKRLEEIVVFSEEGGTKTIRLDLDRPALSLLRRIRDEAHRFAIRYHRHLRNNEVGELLRVV